MWTRTGVSERLGIRYPIVQGPFGGGLSSARLVAAVSDAGGLGCYGAHHLSPEQILATVAEIRALTSRPFAMNLWIPLPGEREERLSRDAFEANVARLRPYLRELGVPEPELTDTFSQRFEDQLAALIEARPPAISMIFGVPPADALAEAKRRGIVAIGTATTVDEAVALDDAGVDLIVASGSDAGGHRAAFLRPVEESLVGTFSLIPQVVDAVEAPVIAAGGIADGRGIVAALALGAQGVQVGTTFLASDESGASTAHKDALVGDQARHTALTRVFSGRFARGIRNRFMTEMRACEAALPPYPIQNWFTRPLRRAAEKAGRADVLALWAGQAAALSRRRPAADILAALVEDTKSVLRQRLPQRLGAPEVDESPGAEQPLAGHVIVAGYGVAGRLLGEMQELSDLKVETFLVCEAHWANDRTLAEFHLIVSGGAHVVAIGRAGEMVHKPRAFETIRSGDVIYLVGEGPQVLGALLLLAEGPPET